MVRLLGRSLLFIVLTILTQVGGVVYLLSIFVSGRFVRSVSWEVPHWVVKVVSFIALYCIAICTVVPALAALYGRVRMPMFTSHHIRPVTIWTCLLNRNYVRPQLRSAVYEVGDKMAAKYPGTNINYLDANFPFFNGFPLLPHLSHNDGKKLDLSFCYDHGSTGTPTNDVPSFIGYGICEEPLPGEVNTAEGCYAKGYRQYSILRYIVPQGAKANFAFNAQRTKGLVSLLVLHKAIDKIFIEPHLKSRLGLSSSKVRFHSCRAVRHDDHVHIQVR
ncbi:hypothetical protein [Nemorincola caseinilytica]|uniref:hypothetical protein n=1 Tax=Nemorincola caseinilytica TaxID=2054315 RepID=UPI0031EB6D3F